METPLNAKALFTAFNVEKVVTSCYCTFVKQLRLSYNSFTVFIYEEHLFIEWIYFCPRNARLQLKT